MSVSGVRGLFERDVELRALEEAVHSTGRVLLVSGPAGIGKTSLLGVGREHALGAGCLVLRARGGVLEQAIGYGVVRQLFEAVVASAEPPQRRKLLAGAAAHASSALAVHAFDDAAGSAATPAEESVSMHGLYWLAANLAAERPLALVVDDAQWCDQSSVRWLLYLARRISGLPIVVLVGVRTGEPDVSYEVLDLLAAEPSAQMLRPAPLSVDGCAAVLGEVFERTVDQALGRACHEWTGGNPLLLRELALGMDAGGVAPEAHAIERIRALLPDKLVALTLLRAGRQSAETVGLLRAIAIFGEAGLGEASALAGIDPATAEQAADRLADAQLLDRERPLRFVHPVIREVIYSDVMPARRAADHKRAARLLAARGAHADVVAAHLLRSAPAADSWVVEHLQAAATSELEQGSPTSAALMLSRALSEPPARDERWRILHELGRAQFMTGDFAALSTLQEALAVSSDPDQRSDTALLLGTLLTYAGQAEEAVAVLEPAIGELDSRDDRRLALESTLLAATSLDRRLRPIAERHTARARERASSGSYGSRLLNAQLAYRSAISGSPVEDTLALARAALDGDRLIHEALGRPGAYVPAISMLAICDALEEADGHYATATAVTQTAGRAIDFAVISTLRSWTSRALGRLSAAEVQARDAVRLAAEYPELTVAVGGMARSHLALVLIDRGDYEEAESLLGPDPGAHADEAITWARDLLYAAGRLRASQSRFGDAAELLLACGRLHEQAGIVNPAFVPWRSEAALALHGLGDDGRSQELAREELALAERVGVQRAVGVALRAVGLITGGEAGLEKLRESVTALERSPSRLHQAHSIIALGGALRRAGHRADARPVLERGLALAAECSATVLIEEAEAELATLGVRPRSASGAESLTASERRVALMAARGMTNPQIAQALFVTRATVESHLHRSYQKLDITSRAQLTDALM